MTALSRAASTLLVATVALTALTGCSLLFPEVARDDAGQVLEASVMGSTEMLVGDCFSFVDGSELSEAEVTPCGDAHSHIVIGIGEVGATEIADAGSVQNAVSSSCSENFSAFKETVAEGVRPDQEFIISERTNDKGAQVTGYACIATDAPQA
ncbi:MAG: hypothetical protein ACOH1K_02655 [Rhodoglobus sp.]